MLTRQTKHILKYQTNNKTNYLELLFSDYKSDLLDYIKLIIEGNLPLKQFISSKNLPDLNIKHSIWKGLIYKQASQIIRSQLKKSEDRRYRVYRYLYAKCLEKNRFPKFTNKHYKDLNLKPILTSKYFSIPNLKNLTIEFNCLVFDIQKNKNSYFDQWVRIYTPYFYKEKHRSIKICLPVQNYSWSNKYLKSWNRKNTISIRKNEKGQYFLNFFYEKEEPKLKKDGEELGLDQGYNKLLSDSNGNHYGRILKSIYERISRKKQGSKSCKRLLIFRDNEINFACNQLCLENVKHLIIENLKYIKFRSHQKHTHSIKLMNKLQRWSYKKTISKLERLCLENGILLTKVSPSYTSQTCSRCGTIDKGARNGEIYHCQFCGLKMDADTNGAINILQRGRICLKDSIHPLSSKN